MPEMTGKGLWEEVERLARLEQGVNDTWNVTSIMIMDGTAFYRLNKAEGKNEISGNMGIPLVKE